MYSKKRKYFLYNPAILFLLTLFFCVPKCKANEEPPPNAWMSHVPDGAYLRDINIPGTHESATARTAAFKSAVASCQTNSIPEQLNKGIRYLDLRVNSDLLINHDGVSCYKNVFNRLYLNHVLDYVNQFLTDNPSETVIIQLKEEGDGKADFETSVNDILSKYPNIYQPQKAPGYITIGDIRGNILIFSRSKNLDLAYKYNQWADNCTYWPVRLGSSFGILQDTYKDATAEAKMNHIESFYDTAWRDRTNSSKFIICFTSCIGPLNPKSVSKEINKQFEKYVSAHRSHRFGIVLMDNPEPSLIYQLYNLNYPH